MPDARAKWIGNVRRNFLRISHFHFKLSGFIRERQAVKNAPLRLVELASIFAHRFQQRDLLQPAPCGRSLPHRALARLRVLRTVGPPFSQIRKTGELGAPIPSIGGCAEAIRVATTPRHDRLPALCRRRANGLRMDRPDLGAVDIAERTVQRPTCGAEAA